MSEEELVARCVVWSYFARKHGYFNCNVRTDPRITSVYEYRLNNAHNFYIEEAERLFKSEGKK